MTEANISIENVGELKIVHISGQLDESNIDEKIKEIYKLMEQTPKGLKIILDLENLEYMNSKSIGYLTDIYGKLTESGGKIAITKAKTNIIDILQVVGLNQLIQIFETMEEAKLNLQESAPAVSATPIIAQTPPSVSPAPSIVTPQQSVQTSPKTQQAQAQQTPSPALPATPVQNPTEPPQPAQKIQL